MGKIITAWIIGFSLPTTLWVMVTYTEVGKEVFVIPFLASLLVNIVSIANFIINIWESK